MEGLSIVILAAGKGERMVSDKPKVMHEIMGKPMISYVIERAKELLPSNITVIVGFGKDKILPYIKRYDIDYRIQVEQKGTAHAVLCAEDILKHNDTLILYGDVPLIESSTIENFIEFYKSYNTITFMTTKVEDPSGYGRVIRDGNLIKAIIEDAEADKRQKRIKEINTGICIIPKRYFYLLKEIKNENRKGEYYLTDICLIANNSSINVMAYYYPKNMEVLGVNNRIELLEANVIMKERIIQWHLKKGVTLLDKNIYIEDSVKIGKDTIIYPNTHILGNAQIGRNVIIGPNTVIKDSFIKDNVVIKGFSHIEGLVIEKGTVVNPFTVNQK
ncbi:MAG TPA: NTP transferase domain-containing protein [Syntrophorhabdaceae bacterium]|nr:NTP transferase domain-containing protein [Syntrophorhabdaceae bacterium]HPU30775.1 NTP transferase domain-containing protein [Syntrophorhabdaceae bacterium]